MQPQGCGPMKACFRRVQWLLYTGWAVKWSQTKRSLLQSHYPQVSEVLNKVIVKDYLRDFQRNNRIFPNFYYENFQTYRICEEWNIAIAIYCVDICV